MKKRIYIYINGIFNLPSNSDAWTDRAVTWTHKHKYMYSYFAEKYEYFSDVIFRRFRQQKRAEKLARMICHYSKDWHMVLVGHSNGCDVIMRALRLMNDYRVREIHFFAPACSRKEKYGISTLLKAGLLDKFRIYIGGDDEAMRLARLSTKLLRPFSLGYGDLGGDDIEDLKRVLGSDTVISEPKFDHSTWWEKGANFEDTMNRIIPVE